MQSKDIDDAVGYWGETARHLPLKWNKWTRWTNRSRPRYKVEDVKYVILSHAHLDHAGGLITFRRRNTSSARTNCATRTGPNPARRWAFILNDFIPTRGYDWLELGADFDLFGRRQFEIPADPGHTLASARCW